MSTYWAGTLFIVVLIAGLAVSHVPLGDYMARVYLGDRHLRAERWVYRVTGVNPDAEQKWGTYLRSVLAFSLLSVLFLYGMLRLQGHLPFNPKGFSGKDMTVRPVQRRLRRSMPRCARPGWCLVG